MSERISGNFDKSIWQWLTVGLTMKKSSSVCVVCCTLCLCCAIHWMVVHTSRRFCTKTNTSWGGTYQNWPFHSKQKSSGQRGTLLIAFLMSVFAVYEPTPDVLTKWMAPSIQAYDTEHTLDEILSLTEVPFGYDRSRALLNFPGTFFRDHSNCWPFIFGERWL